jgi:predicted anti-sigma-YlaC factor YlaD
MMHCNKATEIIEKSKFQKLSLNEMINLRMHLTMCSKCKNYQKLSAELDDLISRSFALTNSKHLSQISLSIEEKNRLIDKLSNI